MNTILQENVSANRRWGIRPAIIALIFIVAYGAAWLAGAAFLRQQTQRWLDAQRAHGVEIRSDAPSLANFPFMPTVTFAHVAAAMHQAEGGWSWEAPMVRVSGVPLITRQIALDFAGTHTASGLWASVVDPVSVHTDQARMTLALGVQGRLTHTTTELSGVSVSSPNTTMALLGIDHVISDIAVIATDAPEPVTTSRLMLDLTHLTLPAASPPLGAQIQNLHIAAEMEGPVASGPLPQALNAWREAGGAINVREFTLDWAPVSISGSGTLALDEALQPMGAFTLKISGFLEALDGLVAQGAVRKDEGAAARVVLSLLAKKSGQDVAPQITVPVTAQNRKLYVGPLALMELAPVMWPANITIP